MYKITKVLPSETDTIYFEYEDPAKNFVYKWAARANCQILPSCGSETVYKSWTSDCMWKLAEAPNVCAPRLSEDDKEALDEALETIKSVLSKL